MLTSVLGGYFGVYVDVSLHDSGEFCQCMLMCREISLEASGNRHALRIALHVL